MKISNYLAGLLSDIFSSLAWASIIIVIAFVIALAAGWMDLETALKWLYTLTP